MGLWSYWVTGLQCYRVMGLELLSFRVSVRVRIRV